MGEYDYRYPRLAADVVLPSDSAVIDTMEMVWATAGTAMVAAATNANLPTI